MSRRAHYRRRFSRHRGRVLHSPAAIRFFGAAYVSTGDRSRASTQAPVARASENPSGYPLWECQSQFPLDPLIQLFGSVRVSRVCCHSVSRVAEAMVGGGGFEPPKAEPSDLQSDPVVHFGNRPWSRIRCDVATAAFASRGDASRIIARNAAVCQGAVTDELRAILVRC